MSKVYWPLMKDCITVDDKKAMSDFVLNAGRFTNGPRVKQFEEEWSKWLGVKRSLFVSSGSTANFLLLAAVKELYGLKDGDKVLVPAVTWVTNIGPVIQLGLEPVFCDVDKHTFSFDKQYMKQLSLIHDDIKAVFVSHLFGVPAEIEEYKEILPDAVFIEDVCESHGARCKTGMAGTLSEGSTFSFYFGHHITTVEGGMVSTNNEELYQLMRAKRSHGMARECDPEYFQDYVSKYPEIHPMFMFITDGYNFRNSEIYAVLGTEQLKRLTDQNIKREENYEKFRNIISKYPDIIKCDLVSEGTSSFCLQFICESEEKRNILEQELKNRGIETRPLCSGNLLRQPFLKGKYDDPENFPNAEYLHTHGFFIGNNHLITDEDFERFESDLERSINEVYQW
jgi:CDP-6-deoxy-D-xylo-4-hexulose-3-dehydrase